jgi:hypothetical protein
MEVVSLCSSFFCRYGGVKLYTWPHSPTMIVQKLGENYTIVYSEVFLEVSAIPFILIYPRDTGGVPWNAYIYDFFKHGNIKALVEANRIRGGDVWFYLKDFSLILAAITASLSSFLSDSGDEQSDMLDFQSDDDRSTRDHDDSDEEQPETQDTRAVSAKAQAKQSSVTRPVPTKKAPKTAVAESWEDELSSTSEGEDGSSPEADSDKVTDSWAYEDKESELKLVLAAFELLKKILTRS